MYAIEVPGEGKAKQRNKIKTKYCTLRKLSEIKDLK